MTDWKPFESAPTDGSMFDVWVKRWNPHTDSFQYSRIADVYYGMNRFSMSLGNTVLKDGTEFGSRLDNCKPLFWSIPEGPKE